MPKINPHLSSILKSSLSFALGGGLYKLQATYVSLRCELHTKKDLGWAELQTSTITLLKRDTTTHIVNKFNENNVTLFKFKMIILDEKDLWDTVKRTEKAFSNDSDLKVVALFKKSERRTLCILCIHMVDAQIQHVKSCKGAGKHKRPCVTFMRPRA